MSFSLINRRILQKFIPQLLISYQVFLQADEFFQDKRDKKVNQANSIGVFIVANFDIACASVLHSQNFPACCFFKKSKHFCTSASILFRSVKISIQQSGHCDFLLNVDSTKCVPNAFSTTGAHALPIISVVNQRTEKVDVLKDENLSKNQH